MIVSKTITLTGSPQQIDIPIIRHAATLILQADSDNTDPVYIGDRAVQETVIPVEGS